MLYAAIMVSTRTVSLSCALIFATLVLAVSADVSEDALLDLNASPLLEQQLHASQAEVARLTALAQKQALEIKTLKGGREVQQREQPREVHTTLGEGEATGVGRRAAGGMVTAGSFSLSSGSNRAGNDEALLKEGLEAHTEEPKNAARCAPQGSLDCSASNVPPNDPNKDKIEKCPDDLSAGAYFVRMDSKSSHGARGKGFCVPFSMGWAIKNAVMYTQEFHTGQGAAGSHTTVLTKAAVLRPGYADKGVAMLAMKRIVCISEPDPARLGEDESSPKAGAKPAPKAAAKGKLVKKYMDKAAESLKPMKRGQQPAQKPQPAPVARRRRTGMQGGMGMGMGMGSCSLANLAINKAHKPAWSVPEGSKQTCHVFKSGRCLKCPDGQVEGQFLAIPSGKGSPGDSNCPGFNKQKRRWVLNCVYQKGTTKQQANFRTATVAAFHTNGTQRLTHTCDDEAVGLTEAQLMAF